MTGLAGSRRGERDELHLLWKAVIVVNRCWMEVERLDVPVTSLRVRIKGQQMAMRLEQK